MTRLLTRPWVLHPSKSILLEVKPLVFCSCLDFAIPTCKKGFLAEYHLGPRMTLRTTQYTNQTKPASQQNQPQWIKQTCIMYSRLKQEVKVGFLALVHMFRINISTTSQSQLVPDHPSNYIFILWGWKKPRPSPSHLRPCWFPRRNTHALFNCKCSPPTKKNTISMCKSTEAIVCPVDVSKS